jgi:hypothetical protein
MANQDNTDARANADAIRNDSTTRSAADASRGTGTSGDIRRPQPDGVAQDPDSAATQRRVHEDAEAIRAEAARVQASTPPEVRDRTVGEIAKDAERRAER